MSLIRRLAKYVLTSRCKQLPVAKEAFAAWKSLPLELAAALNPFIWIRPDGQLPANLERDYYPAYIDDVTLAARTVTLDVLEPDEPDLLQAAHAITAFRQGGEETHFLDMAHIWFLQAGDSLFAKREYNRSLRSYVNACRLLPEGDTIYPFMWRRLAHCLQQLGDFRSAGVNFALAAEAFLQEERLQDASECFEVAALCWERLPAKSQYRFSTVHDTYESTTCARKAKYVYLTIGAYTAVSRCAIMEHDCVVKWSSNATIVLRAMRWMWLYGESPLYVLRSLIVVLLMAATLFFYAGMRHGDTLIYHRFAWMPTKESVSEYGDALYLAAVTISTLGYGDYTPAGGLSRAVAGVSSFLGVIMAAMLIVALQRRYVGR